MKSLFAIALLTAGLQALHLNTATTLETESFITIHAGEPEALPANDAGAGAAAVAPAVDIPLAVVATNDLGDVATSNSV